MKEIWLGKWKLGCWHSCVKAAPPAIQSEEQRPVNNRSRQTKMSEFWAPWKVLADSYGNEQVQPSLTENPEQIQPLLAGIIREAEEKYLTEQNHEKSSLQYKHQNLPRISQNLQNLHIISQKSPPLLNKYQLLMCYLTRNCHFWKLIKYSWYSVQSYCSAYVGKIFQGLRPSNIQVLQSSHEGINLIQNTLQSNQPTSFLDWRVEYPGLSKSVLCSCHLFLNFCTVRPVYVSVFPDWFSTTLAW